MPRLIERIPEADRDSWSAVIRGAALSADERLNHLVAKMDPESVARVLMRDNPHPWRKWLVTATAGIALVPVGILLTIMSLGISDNLEALIDFLPRAGEDPSRNRAMLEEVTMGVMDLSFLLMFGLFSLMAGLYFWLQNRHETDAFLKLPENLRSTVSHPHDHQSAYDLLDPSPLKAFEDFREESEAVNDTSSEEWSEGGSEEGAGNPEMAIYYYLAGKALREVRDRRAVEFYVKLFGALLTHRDHPHTEAATKGLWSLYQHHPVESLTSVEIEEEVAPIISAVGTPVGVEFATAEEVEGDGGSASPVDTATLERIQRRAGIQPSEGMRGRTDITAAEQEDSLRRHVMGGSRAAGAVATPLAVVMRRRLAQRPRPPSIQRWSFVLEEVVPGEMTVYSDPAIDLYRLPLLGAVETAIEELQCVVRSADDTYSEIQRRDRITACRREESEYRRQFLAESYVPVQAPELGAISVQTVRQLGLQLHALMLNLNESAQTTSHATQLAQIVTQWLGLIERDWMNYRTMDAEVKIAERNQLIDNMGLMCIALLKPGLLPEDHFGREDQELWHRWEYYTSQNAINTLFFKKLSVEARVKMVHLLLSRVKAGANAADLTLRSREVQSGALLVLGLLQGESVSLDWTNRTTFSRLFRRYVELCIVEPDPLTFWRHQNQYVLLGNLHWLLEPGSGCNEQQKNRRLANAFLNRNDRQFYLRELIPLLNEPDHRDFFSDLRVRLLGLLLYGATVSAQERSCLFPCWRNSLSECRTIVHAFCLLTLERDVLFVDGSGLQQAIQCLPDSGYYWVQIKLAAESPTERPHPSLRGAENSEARPLLPIHSRGRIN